MAIKLYNYNYNFYAAEVQLKVDTSVFTDEKAQDLLDFFSWRYDKEKPPVDELLKKYALMIIEVATAENYNEEGVKEWFDKAEGCIKIDGSEGLELIYVSSYEFDEEELTISITEEI